MKTVEKSIYITDLLIFLLKDYMFVIKKNYFPIKK